MSESSEKKQRANIIGIAINVREQLGLPPTHLSNAVSMLWTHTPTDIILTTPAHLAITAQSLRATIASITTTHIHSLIAALNGIPDVGQFKPLQPNTTREILWISTWSKQKFAQLDWGIGVGGSIERVRMPSVKFEDVAIVFPEVRGEDGEEGGLEVLLGLEEETMALLREDKLMGDFVVWR